MFRDLYDTVTRTIPSNGKSAPTINSTTYTLFIGEPITPKIVDVIFHDPATIIKWSDGVKTVVKCQKGDTYDHEKGLAMAVMKRFFGNKGSFNDVFKKWLPKETYQNKGNKIEVTVKPDMKEVEKQLEGIKEKLGLSF